MARSERCPARTTSSSPKDTPNRARSASRTEQCKNGPKSGRTLKAPPPSPVSVDDDESEEVLSVRFGVAVEQLSGRVQAGGYIAEQCTVLAEIARICRAPRCPDAVREHAVEVMLRLTQRPAHEPPCCRGLTEMIERFAARGITSR